jgi:hypothetical protein
VDHILQLFDGCVSLADGVASFLHEGLVRDEVVVAVMSHSNWQQTTRRLRTRGVNIDTAIGDAPITLFDSADALRKVLRNGIPDRDRFNATMGTLVHRVRGSGRPVRVYGDMVDLLAAQGDFRSAERLEALWNELREHVSFTLLCGYSAVNFGDPCTADALRQLCRAHTRVRTNPLDPLSAHLLRSGA